MSFLTKIFGTKAPAVHKLQEERNVDKLIKALDFKGDWWDRQYAGWVRRQAAIVLGEIGDKSAIKPLVKKLADEHVYYVVPNSDKPKPNRVSL